MYVITSATEKIANLNKRIRAIPGGTSAGKTIAVCQVLIDLAQRDKTPTVTSIVSESFPHLTRGAMRDFIDILQKQEYYKDQRWNRTQHTYHFETGSIIEFFSVDQPDKVRGPRRTRLFVNEANNIPFEAFEQLEIRTKECIFLDWNPTTEFWYYTDIEGKRDDVDELTLTYKDNEALDPAIVESIERRRDRKGWWKVYGEGQLGEVEGKIYTGWRILDELPPEAHLRRYGLDYGYTNDPTAIVAIYRYNGAYILDEIAFQKGLSNRQIADIFLNNEKALVIADSAEPKSNDEIKDYGVPIIGAQKGSGSVNTRIQFVQDKKIFVTKRSINVIKEYRNYLWTTDKNGKILNEPEHQYSHSMDASGYAIASFMKPEHKTSQTTPGWIKSRWQKPH